MEAAGIIMLKSFGLGLFLGYLTGYFIKRGIKTLLLLVIAGAVLIYFSGQSEAILGLWKLTGDFFMKLLIGAVNMVRTRLESYFTCNAWVFGFIAGSLWSLTKSK